MKQKLPSIPHSAFQLPSLALHVMRRLHLVVGVATLVAFLLTGQYMDYLEVRTNALGETARVMFRSRHIYLLLAGLVNVGLGAYFSYRARGWRRGSQLL